MRTPQMKRLEELVLNQKICDRLLNAQQAHAATRMTSHGKMFPLGLCIDCRCNHAASACQSKRKQQQIDSPCWIVCMRLTRKRTTVLSSTYSLHAQHNISDCKGLNTNPRHQLRVYDVSAHAQFRSFIDTRAQSLAWHGRRIY